MSLLIKAGRRFSLGWRLSSVLQPMAWRKVLFYAARKGEKTKRRPYSTGSLHDWKQDLTSLSNKLSREVSGISRRRIAGSGVFWRETAGPRLFFISRYRNKEQAFGNA